MTSLAAPNYSFRVPWWKLSLAEESSKFPYQPHSQPWIVHIPVGAADSLTWPVSNPSRS